MVMLTFQVFLTATPEQPVAQLNRGGYELYGLVSSIVMFVVIMASALGTHNRIPLLRQPSAHKIGPIVALKNMFEAMITLLAAIEAGADSVDAAMDSMSGSGASRNEPWRGCRHHSCDHWAAGWCDVWGARNTAGLAAAARTAGLYRTSCLSIGINGLVGH